MYLFMGMFMGYSTCKDKGQLWGINSKWLSSVVGTLACQALWLALGLWF